MLIVLLVLLVVLTVLIVLLAVPFGARMCRGSREKVVSTANTAQHS